MGVYYFGEEVDICKNGEIVDHEGAWESGKGGAAGAAWRSPRRGGPESA